MRLLCGNGACLWNVLEEESTGAGRHCDDRHPGELVVQGYPEGPGWPGWDTAEWSTVTEMSWSGQAEEQLSCLSCGDGDRGGEQTSVRDAWERSGDARRHPSVRGRQERERAERH